MITSFENESSRIFLCYRRNGAMVARAFHDALTYIQDLQFGKVWYSDDHGNGNYSRDIKLLLSQAEYAVLFIEKDFTAGFLKEDGTVNVHNGMNGCITVMEILEIERQRQSRENFRILCVNYHGYTLTTKELNDLRVVFSEAGILRKDSIQAYSCLNQNNYEEQMSQPDFIRNRFGFLAQNTLQTDTKQLIGDALDQLYNRSLEKLKTVEREKFGQDGLQDFLLVPIRAEDRISLYNNLYQAIDDILNELMPGAPIMITARGGQGKSTQLIYLWRQLLNHQDAEERNDCVCLYFDLSKLLDIISDEIKDHKNDFLSILLNNSGLDTKEIDMVLYEMRQIPTTAQTRFFLIFDGLDEVSEDAIILKELGKLSSYESRYTNVQIILAGRNAISSVLTQNAINLRLEDLNWQGERVQQWLINKGISVMASDVLMYDEIARSPMMLLMLCKTNPVINRQKNGNRMFFHKEYDHVSRVEVMWNYIQVLLNGYLTNDKFSREDKDFAQRFMYELLPLAAYVCYFDRNKMYAAEHRLKAIWKNDVYDRCLSLLDGPFSGIIDRNGRFSHRLWRDYFAMLHMGCLIKKLYETNEISDAEYRAITDRRILDNKEYTDLLVSIVPGVLGFTSDRYEMIMVNDLIEFIHDIQDEPEVYNSKRFQCMRLLKAFYPRWTAKYYLSHHPVCKKKDISLPPAIQQNIQDFVQTMLRLSFEFFEDIANTIMNDKIRLLPSHCVSLACCILSQSYRNGCFLMKANTRSRIIGLKPNLNTSLYYAMQAEKMCSFDSTLIDCYNYIAKAFYSAYEELSNSIRKGQNSKVLQPYDLYLNEEMLEGIENILSDSEMKQILCAKPGDELSIHAVKCRMTIIKTLANYWLDKAIEKECVLSMNLKALILEMEQEEKPDSKRCYLEAFQLYYKASQSNHVVSDYSAFKAGQLLAEQKVGLNMDDQPCKSEDACAEKTVREAVMLFEKATVHGQNWERVAMFRGKLRLNFRFFDGKKLSEEEAVSEAYHDFEMAYRDWPVIPVILAFVETGLRLYTFYPQLKNKLQSDVRMALNAFLMKIEQFKTAVTAERHADRWTPSAHVFFETCEKMRSISYQQHDAIAALELSELATQCTERISALQKEI